MCVCAVALLFACASSDSRSARIRPSFVRLSAASAILSRQSVGCRAIRARGAWLVIAADRSASRAQTCRLLLAKTTSSRFVVGSLLKPSAAGAVTKATSSGFGLVSPTSTGLRRDPVSCCVRGRSERGYLLGRSTAGVHLTNVARPKQQQQRRQYWRHFRICCSRRTHPHSCNHAC